MSKIIEPSEDFVKGFVKFVSDIYGDGEFSIAEAANLYFQFRYKTTDKWTDPKNITGFVKRSSEEGELFEYVGIKKSISTGKDSKHYKFISND